MKSKTNNIETFNESAALIFSQLYDNFPVPVCLTYQTLANTLCTEENIDPNHVIDVFINTLSWLKKSGYIWLDSESEREAYGVVLNPKGLEVLKIIPTTDEDNRSIGERLSDKDKPCTQQEKTALINLALSNGINYS